MEKDTIEFHQGDEVQKIVWPDDSCFTVGETGIESISVTMENGQPWFAVWKNGKVMAKWNSAHVAGVIMKEE